MRFASTLLPFLYATFSTSTIIPSFASSSQTTLDKPVFPVPGKNPLRFCTDPKHYILNITNVDLSPNPPVPGSTLNITASGIFSKNVDPGATLFLQVKYGLITLIRQEADMCDRIGNVDLTCPLKKGEMDLTKSVEIPKQVPKGTYSVIADVKSVDGEAVTCMMSEVMFS
jgi:hypothetical protein